MKNKTQKLIIETLKWIFLVGGIIVIVLGIIYIVFKMFGVV